MRSLLLILLIAAACSAPLFAQNIESVVIYSSQRFVSGTTYQFGPQVMGRGSATATNWALDVKLDSGATSTVVTIYPNYGNDQDTLQYQDNAGISYVLNRDFSGLVSPNDGWHCNVAAYISRELGYVITVSATCKLTITQHYGR